MSDDRDFVVEQQPSDLFVRVWWGRDILGISDAVRFGCVYVVITHRPMQDLPLTDLLRWQLFALFVKENCGVQSLRRVLEMRQSCVAAGRHFVWNEKPQPLDAFRSVMYQLIRYSTRN